jgi:hypothetical protein
LSENWEIEPMSDEDAEIFPPGKKLPVARRETSPQPMHDAGRVDTGGIVSSTITRWKAEHQSRALDEIAKRHRSEADAIKAYGEMADAFQNTARKVNQLRSLPETMALDDERWTSERSEEYDELKHRAEMNKRRRQREIEEADTEHVEAKRRKFTAEQGYENQQRLKDRNLKIFATRAEAEHLNAEAKAAKVRKEIGGGEPKKQNARDDIRARAEESLIQALADGNDEEADRWQRVLDALGEGEQ